MTELSLLLITVGETMEETVVTGPPSSLLVRDWMKPCFVDVVVHVDAGWVMVTGMTVVTMDEDVLGVGPLVTVRTVE